MKRIFRNQHEIMKSWMPREYMLANEAEAAALPGDAPAGSVAYTVNNSVRMVMGADGQWHTVSAAPVWPGSVDAGRVVSLTNLSLTSGMIIDAVGIPPYVDDVTDYAAYGLTEPGWYVFARIVAPEGVEVTAAAAVTGAEGSIITTGADHVDVAVKFDTAAQARTVAVNWGAEESVYVFRACDLAVRNLDYRATFYVYDISPYVTWSYALTADTAFTAGKNYYTQAEGAYTLAEVTAGDTVPPVYYTHAYILTTDETFQTGKTYYTESGGEYTAAEVTPGESIAADTYYEDQYTAVDGGTFEDGTAYYTKSGSAFTAVEVTPGNDVPPLYYNHSKITFSGMTRNFTYQFNEIIDCPSEFILPAIEDDGHGAWFEIRLRHAGSYSSTLVPLDPEVKIATEHTQAETAGMNMIDLHYLCVNGV